LGGCVLAEGSSAGSSREKECFLVEEGSYLGCHLSILFWDAVVVMTLEKLAVTGSKCHGSACL